MTAREVWELKIVERIGQDALQKVSNASNFPIHVLMDVAWEDGLEIAEVEECLLNRYFELVN